MITEKEFIEAQKIVYTYKAEQLNKHIVSGSFPLAEISKKAKLELLDGMMEMVIMGWADGKEKQNVKDMLQAEINFLNGNDR